MRNRLIKAHYKVFGNYSLTGKLFGISRQRVHQIVSGYSTTRRSKDGRPCEKCGNSSRVECHHINFDPSDNRKENMMPLCVGCHKEEHVKEFILSKKSRKHLHCG